MSSDEQLRPISVRVGPGAAAGVTEDMICALVHGFYGKVRRDPALGPIFDRVIGGEWDVHLAKMCDFWSSVMLMTGRFKGQPMQAHARVDEIRAPHFARWLQLFRQTAQELCPPEAAAMFIARAEMIAESLQLGIAAHRGELPSRSAQALAAGGVPRRPLKFD